MWKITFCADWTESRRKKRRRNKRDVLLTSAIPYEWVLDYSPHFNWKTMLCCSVVSFSDYMFDEWWFWKSVADVSFVYKISLLFQSIASRFICLPLTLFLSPLIIQIDISFVNESMIKPYYYRKSPPTTKTQLATEYMHLKAIIGFAHWKNWYGFRDHSESKCSNKKTGE